MKVCTVVGTRPELIKLSRVMAALDQAVDQVVIHTGQNFDYELNEIFFKEMGIKVPKYFLNSAFHLEHPCLSTTTVGSSAGFEIFERHSLTFEVIGNILRELSDILQRE